MQVNYQNPLQEEHLVLIKIRKEIIKQFPKSRIEVSGHSTKGDYTAVSTKIITHESEGSICQGQVLSLASPLVNLLKAEIVALTLSANELGIEIQFDGQAEKTVIPEIAPVQERVRFDADSVRSCIDLDMLKVKMKSLGMDDEWERLENHRKTVKRLTIKGAANFLYPPRSPVSYVAVNRQKSALKNEKEKEVVPAPEVKKHVSQRTSDESQAVLSKLSERGITTEVITERTEFKSLLQFALYGTDEQIKEIMK